MPYFDTTHTVYSPEPDYTRPALEIQQEARERILRRLRVLYVDRVALSTQAEIERILKVFHAHKPVELMDREQRFNASDRFTESDVILITYGDLLYRKGQSPLKTLGNFCDAYLKGTINTVHILPFFPSSSDRGFSVIDFEGVDPLLGSWNDIRALEARYQLMFDGVINHVSSKSRWFVEFLAGNPDYEDFFIWFAHEDDLTPADRRMIFRPRTTPILTRYETLKGPRFVWTTFSSDQVDLNYKNPKVLLRIIEILLLYIRQGADILRLDAVTYLWEQPGTRCIHLEQTHEILKLLRDIVSLVAPHVALLTETNVPNDENVAYFGNGVDEAHMVYNFALPPLVLHSFYNGDARILSAWADSMVAPSDTTTFLNFLDSHDGIGLLGARSILSSEDLDLLCRKVESNGGLISHKTAEDDRTVPYELNITWYSALNKKRNGDPLRTQIRRFIASRAVALVLRGVPGIYLHSLFGTHNDHAAVEVTRENRLINRAVIDCRSIMRSMRHPGSKKYRINQALGRMLHARTHHRAFHPNGPQRILSLSPAVFAVKRISPEGDRSVIALINISQSRQRIQIPSAEIRESGRKWHDLLSGRAYSAHRGTLNMVLHPYDVIWLSPG